MASNFINSILPIQQYRYGEFKRFSIFDFMGKMFIAKIAEMKLNKQITDSEIEVTPFRGDEYILNLKFTLNKSNNTLDNDSHACFTIGARKSELIQKVVRILQKSRRNDLPKRIQFRSEGINIYLLEYLKNSPTKINYDGLILSGKVWVDHLVALGLTLENAQAVVTLICETVTDSLQTKRVK